jgi:hypothetical protein
MELPPGRSIPAGDPREKEKNPYKYRKGDADRIERWASASRSLPLDKAERYYGKRDFHDPDAEHALAGLRYPYDIRDDETPDDLKRRRLQAKDSFLEAERRRKQQKVEYMQQFVAQNTRPYGPYQRSFIPHDLLHMLSPNN